LKGRGVGRKGEGKGGKERQETVGERRGAERREGRGRE